MAKALLYRGIAYRQQKLPAQAIADLTSALWLKGGLSDGRPHRRPAAADVGLSGGRSHRRRRRRCRGCAECQRAPPRARRRPTRTGARQTTQRRPARELRRPQQSERLEPRQSLCETVRRQLLAAPHRQHRRRTAAGAADDHGIDRETRAPARLRRATRAARAPAPGPAIPRCRPRRRRLPQQRAASASPRAASASRSAWCARRARRRRWPAKVQREHAAALAARETEIDQTVVGNMGSFYRVRVGPFATQSDGQAACAKLKGSGLDCLVVTQ